MQADDALIEAPELLSKIANEVLIYNEGIIFNESINDNI